MGGREGWGEEREGGREGGRERGREGGRVGRHTYMCVRERGEEKRRE